MSIPRRPLSRSRNRLGSSYDDSDDRDIVLLTDVVGRPALRPDAFDTLIRQGDPCDALEELTRSRLPELSRRKPGLLTRAVQFFVTGRRRTSVEQVRTLVGDLTSVSQDVAAYVAARNSVDNARMKTATAPLRYGLQEEALRAETARYQSDTARFRARAAGLANEPESPRPEPPAPTPAPAAPPAPPPPACKLCEQHGDADRRKLVLRRARTEVRRARSAVHVVRRRQEAVGVQLDEAKRARDDVIEELQERNAEVDRLSAEVEGLKQDIEDLLAPPAVRARRHAEELAEADHKVALAKKQAEVSEHRSKAKEHRQRKLPPAEEFARRARERVREATTKRRAVNQLRREIEERLARTAERHGEDSEEYANERDMYDELLLELEEAGK